jgi:hypothetical protein
MHTGNDVPKSKRRWLLILSAIALLPLFVVMSVIQILSVRSLSPELVPINNIEIFFVVLCFFLGFVLQGLVWVFGWLIFLKKGWLHQSHQHRYIWAELPNPILLPPLPLPVDDDTVPEV